MAEVCLIMHTAPAFIIRTYTWLIITHQPLSPSNTETVYTFNPVNYYYMHGFEIYFNNANIIMTDTATWKLIHMDLDTLSTTEKTITGPGGVLSSGPTIWPTIYNKYVYLSYCFKNSIRRVLANLNCFQDDTIIFPNKGSE